MGNILLNSFDSSMNCDGITCLRYIDDFIILGPDEKIVRKALKKALNILSTFELTAYDLDEAETKATSGKTREHFDYLGCQISDGFVLPCAKSRNKLLGKIDLIIGCSKKHLLSRKMPTSRDYDLSYRSTLSQIHLLIRSWGNQYSFCNADQVFCSLDEQIDQKLTEYTNIYARRLNRTEPQLRRRLMGVHLLSDCKSKSIYPLDDSDELDQIFNR
jgi:RNA-directed DNA polymerase